MPVSSARCQVPASHGSMQLQREGHAGSLLVDLSFDGDHVSCGPECRGDHHVEKYHADDSVSEDASSRRLEEPAGMRSELKILVGSCRLECDVAAGNESCILRRMAIYSIGCQ